MNRPRFSDYISSARQTIDFEGYAKALEIYCYQLEKALDKIYEKTAYYSCAPISHCTASKCDGECWKEWAMKDE